MALWSEISAFSTFALDYNIRAFACVLQIDGRYYAF